MVYHTHVSYSVLSKAQHVVSKVNQLPWHYTEWLHQLKSDLKDVMKKGYEGSLKIAKEKLKLGELETGTLIVTEERRRTRVTIDENSISEEMEKARQNVCPFCTALISDIDDRVNVDVKVGIMREVFADFKPATLSKLLRIAESLCRNYGSLDKLLIQLDVMKQRFKETPA